MKNDELREILRIFFLFAFIILVSLAYLFGADTFRAFYGFLTGISHSEAPQMSADMQRYFELKNRSCHTLSADFLAVLTDRSEGELVGLKSSTPHEAIAAESVISSYWFNQTTKIYSRGDWLKLVMTDAEGERTTIWKESRIYECRPNCTMRLMTDSESDAYYGMLADMRSSCLYFGNTQMPDSVDLGLLLLIDYNGTIEHNAFRCERFLISGNATYAQSLLSSGQEFDEDQQAVLWLFSHLNGPMEECLDDGTGIAVFRKLSIDLTHSYQFDYGENGHMHVNQSTELLYFSNDVPASFFGIPG